MSFSHILFETDESGVALITINRPEKRNALSRAVLDDIGGALDRLWNDGAIRAAIVTGSGEKAFIAGADIAEIETTAPLEAAALSYRVQELFRRMERSPKPIVAAINGFALGGGLELAMACTVRFASENAILGQPEVKLGIIPGYGGTQRLPRLVGRGRALELLLTGEAIPAQEAHRIGLVNAVTPQSELLAFSRAWLKKVLANGPAAVRLTMEAVDAGANMALDDGLRFESTSFGLAAATEDRREGLRAFLEKRPAVFTGK
jgi:enoyl-CoA hydratase